MKFDVVAIAAAEGGIGSLRKILSELPADFPVPVLCLQPGYVAPSAIENLQASTGVSVRWAKLGETVEAGCAYFAPPGTTLIMRPDRKVALAPFGTESQSLEPENLFLTSIRNAFGNHTLSVLLSGSPADGLSGAKAIREAGGTVIAQEKGPWPYRAAVDSVIDAGYADDILPLEEIATALRLRILGPRLLERAEIKLELTPVLDAALAVQRTRLGNIQLLDRVTDTLHIVAQYGFRADFLEHFQVMSVDDDSLDSARAIRAQHRVVIEDVELDPLYAPHRKIASAAGYRAVQSTPFFARGRHLLGVLSTHSARPLTLTSAQARNLDEFAAVAGDVVAGHL